MNDTGTWGRLMKRSDMPSEKTILRPRLVFKVKDTELPQTFDLYTRTTSDGSKQQIGVDFDIAYAPIALTDDIKTCLAIAAALKLKLYVIDASNSFQVPITFDKKKRSYLSLPFKYKDWYVQNCPNDPMLQIPSNQLVIPCLRGIQVTKNAGNDWYKLISGLLEKLGLYKVLLIMQFFIGIIKEIISFILMTHATCTQLYVLQHMIY